MSTINHDQWEAVIGLEIHVQLSTQSKLFSPAPNRFGDEPNTNISYVCTGQPGTLPVLNKEAVKKAVQFACAVNANVALYSEFDRKSYFYPDSPRNYQITQFYHPIMEGGKIEVEMENGHKEFNINRAHIEDDAGMLKHFSSFAGVDYNRAGVPLLEIVSEPCMHNSKEAVAYGMAIRAIMLYLGASDCNMEEGSLRIDANISVRPKGEKTLRPKVEIKNMNSFSNMELAIDTEIQRQIKLYTDNPETEAKNLIQSATYRFDLEKKEMVMMREKEEAKDYRYFPEPDLPPLVLSQEYVEEIRRSLPELPHVRTKRYVQSLGLTEYAASVLINDKPLCDFFEECLKTCKNAKSLCNWITVEFVGRFKDSGKSLPTSGIKHAHISKLVNLIESNTITGKIAKSVADIMVQQPGKDPEEIVNENPDFRPVQDYSEIEAIINETLKENEQSVIDFKNGKGRAFDFLVGQVMKKTRGKASPAIVNEILTKKLK